MEGREFRYLYFPGCSMREASAPAGRSVEGACDALGIALLELPDWNCCGITASFSVDDEMALAVGARNLAIAEMEGGRELVTACSGCFLTLNRVNDELRKFPERAERIRGALKEAGLDYRGYVKVRHLLDILANDYGLERIRERASKGGLSGLKVVAYYGCQTVRPYCDFDDPYNPQTLDKLLEALGAEVLDFRPYKVKCCGASLSVTDEGVMLRLVSTLLSAAKRRGAEAIVTPCPFCHFNLEAFQRKASRLAGEDLRVPVLFLTQAVGLALGLSPEEVGLLRSLSPVGPLMKRVGG